MAIKVRIIREAKKKGVDGKECWDGYKYAGSEDTDGDGKDDKDKCVPMKKEEKSIEEIIDKIIEEVIQEIDKDRMKCNKPRYLKKDEAGYGKKQKVVKACKKGKEKLVKFGDAKMRNNSDKPKNKTDFRKRHNCSDKEDNMKAGYWACKDW
jgi:hypothetical protein